jgi:hypothetical protein
MNPDCGKEWTRAFMRKTFTAKFINQTYKEARERIKTLAENANHYATLLVDRTQELADATAENIAYARKMDALGLGKGIIGNQVQQANLGLASGNSSVVNAGKALDFSTYGDSAMSSGYGNAVTGFNSVASAANTLGNTQANTFYDAQKYGTSVGTNVGTAIGGLWSAIKPSISSAFTPTEFGTGSSFGNQDLGSFLY